LFSKLRNRYVCGYRDIKSEGYAGDSGTHLPDATAVDTTNGAGPHNIQIFVLNSDGIVLHCLTGFWNSSDLAKELELAERLNGIWNDHSIIPEQKLALFRKMQVDHIRDHSPEMVARSHLQSFDKRHEAARKRDGDTIRNASLIDRYDTESMPPDEAFRTTDEIMHLRIASRPFVPYEAFDVARFADYGTMFYDKHEANMDEYGRQIDPDAGLTTIKSGQTWKPRRN
jgi:hypothetical protein